MDGVGDPEPTVPPGIGPRLKDVEVSAKEIVDRISNNSSTTSTDDQQQQLQQTLQNLAISRRLSSTSTNQDASTSAAVKTAEQKGIEQLLNAVEKWVLEANTAAETGSPSSVDKMHWVYSIESYLRSLDADWTSHKTLTHKITNQFLHWLKQLFHFADVVKNELEYNCIHPHWDMNSSMLTFVQLNLFLKFPKLLDVGPAHLQEENKWPMIYCGDELIGQQLCCKLGLPFTCSNVVDFANKSWIEILEQKILADTKLGFVPIALLLNTAVQKLEQGVKLADAYNLWVHIYGVNVLSYFLKRPESNQIGNSFTIDLTRWFKNPKLPFLTVYKRQDHVDPTAYEMCDLGMSRNEIMCFTPWFISHIFGRSQLTAAVNESILRGNFLLQMIQRYPCLRIVPNWTTLSDSTILASTLTFQYNPPNFKRDTDNEAISVPAGSGDNDSPTVPYVDTLNSWLFHIMERDLKGLLPVEFVFVESSGWNIHVDVVRCPKFSSEDESSISSMFDNHLVVLQATVKQKIQFCKLVKESEELEWVDHESQWAGLGAVRYIPMFHRSSSPSVSPNGDEKSTGDARHTELVRKAANAANVKENIDHLNAKIVDKLKAIDTAFSLGESASGDWCVQFGMVTDETDVKELVRLVVSTGQEIEESAEFFSRMSDLVKKGIEKATEELRKESEEALWEEGILRRVPVVGTFVNWFSPPTKETGVRGRALNLTQGKVESTENIYKYHMQVDASSIKPKLSLTNSTNTNNGPLQ